MKIYKVSIKNKDLQQSCNALYFKERRTAEATVNLFNQLLKEGKVIEWECEVIEVLSHKEAFQQFMSIANENLSILVGA